MNWEWAEVNLSDVVQEALNGTKALFTQRDLSIESDLDSSLPAVWNDRDILLQVMTNLLGNSIKFTPWEMVMKCNGVACMAKLLVLGYH
jgi:two-component system sensor histidine kinase NblS